MGNGENLNVIHTVFTTLPSKSQNLKLKNVLHALAITKNLLSVSKFTADNDVLIEFDAYGCFVKDKRSGETLLKGKLKEGLYEFQNPKARCGSNNPAVQNDVHLAFSVSDSIKKLWHLRLGHPSERVLNQVLKSCNVKIKENEPYFCEPCQYGKNKALPFKLSDSRANTPLQLIHTDLWGPSSVQSVLGYKYYVQFLDDFSRYSWIYPLKSKNEAFSTFIHFKKLVEKHFENQ